MKKTDAEKLQNEYQKLVEGLREADQAREEDSFMANPGKVLLLSPSNCQSCQMIFWKKPFQGISEEAYLSLSILILAEHFVQFLKRFIEYLKVTILCLY